MSSARRKVIFHLAHFRKGGIETTLLQWLRLLDPNEFEVHLSLQFGGHDRALYEDRIPAHVKVTVLLAEPWLSRTREAKYRGTLGVAGRLVEELLLPLPRKWLARQRFERLAAGAALIVDYDLSLGRFFDPHGAPLVGFYHFDLDDLATQYPRRYRRARERFRRYRVIAGVSQDICEQARTLFPDLAGNFLRVRNTFDPVELQARAAEPLPPLPMSDPSVGWLVGVGTLNARKNFSLLLSGYARWRATSLQPCDLVLVGDGPDRAALAQQAAALGIAPHVHLIGHQANPLPWIAGARALALTSTMEGLPTVLIEAQLLGVPCVSTDCPTGPREILDGGRCGELIPLGDEAALCRALHDLMDSAPHRDAIRQRARQHALDLFGPAAGRQAIDTLLQRCQTPHT